MSKISWFPWFPLRNDQSLDYKNWIHHFRKPHAKMVSWFSSADIIDLSTSNVDQSNYFSQVQTSTSFAVDPMYKQVDIVKVINKL